MRICRNRGGNNTSGVEHGVGCHDVRVLGASYGAFCRDWACSVQEGTD